jgi:hypothetical protein
MMARGRTPNFLQRFQTQAGQALAALTSEIRVREADLEGLRARAEAWRDAVLGKSTRGRKASKGKGAGKRAASPRAKSTRGRRVSWDEVLASVPSKFDIDDVMKHPGARSKGREQVYPALTRWVQTKKVKKVGKGTYQKV